MSSGNTSTNLYYAALSSNGLMIGQVQVQNIGSQLSPALADFTFTDIDDDGSTQSIDTLVLLFEDSEGSGLNAAIINTDPSQDNPVYYLSSVPDSSTGDNPALAPYGDYLYAGWLDDDGDVQLASAANNAQGAWQSPFEAMEAYCGIALACDSSTNDLYGLYTATKKDGLTSQTVVLSPGSNTYQTQDSTTVTDSKVKTSPGMTENNGSLYAVWKEKGDKTVYYASRTYPNAWSDAGSIPGASTSANPAVAALDGTLYVAWVDDDTSGLMYATMDSSGNWSDTYALGQSNATSGSGPALAAHNGTMYIAWTEYDGSADVSAIVSGVATAVATIAGLFV